MNQLTRMCMFLTFCAHGRSSVEQRTSDSTVGLYTRISHVTHMSIFLTFCARGRSSKERRTSDLTVGPYTQKSHGTHIYMLFIRCARTPLCRTADLRLDCGSLYTNKSCHTWMFMLLTFGARGRRSVEPRTSDSTLALAFAMRCFGISHGISWCMYVYIQICVCIYI